jgi:hypothetical protein
MTTSIMPPGVVYPGGNPMKTRNQPKPQAPRRDRSNCVMVDLGPMKGTLNQLATKDTPPGETVNLSRTLRRIIRVEAERRGILTTRP